DPAARIPSMALLLDLLARATAPRLGRQVAIAVSVVVVALVASASAFAWWLWPEPTGGMTITTESLVIPGTPDEPAVLHLVAPTPVAAEPERPKAPPPSADELAQIEREGLNALADTVRGQPVDDPEAFDGLMEADDDEIIAAALAGVLQKDADAHADKGNFVAPKWDGKSHLVCMMGDKFLIEKTTIDVPGVAITAMYGCQLHLVDCDATAGTIVQAMIRSEVSITGGTMKATDHFVQNMFGFVTVAGVEIEGEPAVGIDASGGTTQIVDSDLRGKVALRANQKARVRVTGGTLVGTDRAIEAKNGGVVELDGPRRTGELEERLGGRIVEITEAK
ncbi:MAG TPA: hypothetical protein VFG69_12880, partial [Nannocystaceae bacterium]|nr:hypothetical protein [Nannocystaceae bacterium]